MSDTTDLMGVNAAGTSDSPDSTVGPAAAPATDAPAAPATGAATGTASRRRRSGTGLDAMVLAELQQLASSLGIRGTARMRKGQLIEVIKERQAGGPAAPAAEEAEAKPKRRATSRARTGDDGDAVAAPAAQDQGAQPAAGPADGAGRIAGQQQIDIPGQPADGEQPAAERRRRRATAP
ncbi:Rho termination factor N-terminal domain-containing protein, partial [Streptomyces sp. B1866]|uniref:Rho termination factor N-terminal domain-containing protein n=1 Tax=Streptomyces sp. B1866 TaxID=3075431 RepID=UPI00288FDAE2